MTVSKEGPSFRFKGRRIFYGWGIVVALFLIMFVLWGGYYSFGVFFNSLSREFGSTGTLTSGIMSLSLILSGLFSWVMGGLTDRYGPNYGCPRWYPVSPELDQTPY